MVIDHELDFDAMRRALSEIRSEWERLREEWQEIVDAMLASASVLFVRSIAPAGLPASPRLAVAPRCRSPDRAVFLYLRNDKRMAGVGLAESDPGKK